MQQESNEYLKESEIQNKNSAFPRPNVGTPSMIAFLRILLILFRTSTRPFPFERRRIYAKQLSHPNN